MLPKQRNLDGVADSVNEILTCACVFGNLNMLNVRWTAGEPIFGVYPSLDGRKPSFPNPTANLVSAKKVHSSVSNFYRGILNSFMGMETGYVYPFLCCFLFGGGIFCFGGER